MSGDKAWPAVSITIHPEGVGRGLGRGSVPGQSNSFTPNSKKNILDSVCALEQERAFPKLFHLLSEMLLDAMKISLLYEIRGQA